MCDDRADRLADALARFLAFLMGVGCGILFAVAAYHNAGR